jgi:biotin transport system substrate-specific component
MLAATKSTVDKNVLMQIMLCLAGVMLLFVCSQISIPLYPVPITLQTVAVMLIALTYSKKLGIATILLYLLAGAAGLPVYSGYAAGSGILFGSTFGYFLGFVVCAYAMNKIKEKIGSDSFYKIAVNCLAGNSIIFFCGVLWLAQFVGFEAAIKLGFMPFIIPGMVKILILYGLLRTLKTVANP